MRSITASICKTDIMCNINIDRMLLTYFEDKDWGVICINYSWAGCLGIRHDWALAGLLMRCNLQ